MLFRNWKPVVLGLALLFVATAVPQRGRAAADSVPVTITAMEDIPELPAPDGSSDTPEIEVKLVDGKNFKLSSLRGKVTVLDIFASWCHHCQEHAPQIVKVYNQYKAQGFTMLGVASDQQETRIADIKKFIKDYGLNYQVGLLSNEVRAYYLDSRNHGVPQVVLFGKDGKMIKRWIGWTEDNTKELTSLIEGAIGAAATSSATPETKTQTTAAPVAAKTTTAKASAPKAPIRRKK